MHERTIIVVGVDFDSDGDLAFDAAAQIAGTHPVSEVHALFVERAFRSNPPSKGSPVLTTAEAALDRLEQYCKARVSALQAQRPSLWFERVATHVRIGNPAEHLVQLAVDLDADLIVVGSHNRRGVKRLVLGSVSERVVQIARCPVYVVRPKDHLEIGDVPAIEPPCPDCLATQRSTDGAEMWCARHELAKYRPRVHRVMRGEALHDPTPWSQSTPQV